jgi:hypothetical protein
MKRRDRQKRAYERLKERYESRKGRVSFQAEMELRHLSRELKMSDPTVSNEEEEVKVIVDEYGFIRFLKKQNETNI